jgi:hypothetical protein
MTRFPRNSKDDHGDRDIGDSDVNVSGPTPQVPRLNKWSTSRRELWCFYLYFVVRFFPFFCQLRTSFYRFLSSTKREITDSPDSNLARLNSRIFFTSLDMIRASHRLPNHAAAGLTACYPSWDASAIVRLSLPHPSSVTACVAHE